MMNHQQHHQQHHGRRRRDGVPHHHGLSSTDRRVGRALLLLVNGIASGFADATRVLLAPAPAPARVPWSTLTAIQLPPELAQILAGVMPPSQGDSAEPAATTAASATADDAAVEAAIAEQMASESDDEDDLASTRRLYDAMVQAHLILKRDGAQTGPQREVFELLDTALNNVSRPPVVDQDQPENQQLIDRIKSLANALSRGHAVATRLRASLGELAPDSMAARWLEELLGTLKPAPTHAEAPASEPVEATQ